MRLKTKKTLEIDDFNELEDVLKEWFNAEELSKIFQLKQDEYEEWAKDSYDLDDEDMFKPVWILKYLYDYDGLSLEKDDIIRKLIENKDGYFDFTSNNECDYFAWIWEYDLSELLNKQEKFAFSKDGEE